MRLKTLSVVVLAAATLGCAGANTKVVARTSSYPVSFSAAIPGSDGRVYLLSDQLEVVGSFKASKVQVGFLYGQTGGDFDLSEEINQQVKSAGGEGIAMLRVDSEQCALNWFFPLTLLPFWPGCETVDVSGAIVRRVATASIAASPGSK